MVGERGCAWQGGMHSREHVWQGGMHVWHAHLPSTDTMRCGQ